MVSHGVRIAVHRDHRAYLSGTVIDYRIESGAAGFVFNNPNAE